MLRFNFWLKVYWQKHQMPLLYLCSFIPPQLSGSTHDCGRQSLVYLAKEMQIYSTSNVFPSLEALPLSAAPGSSLFSQIRKPLSIQIWQLMTQKWHKLFHHLEMESGEVSLTFLFLTPHGFSIHCFRVAMFLDEVSSTFSHLLLSFPLSHP